MDATLAIINELVQLANLARQVGESAEPFLADMRKWLAKDAPAPTRADIDATHARRQPFLDMLFDTSRDVR